MNINEEIVDILAKELVYNRFCGVIASKNENYQINNQEQLEAADVLANRNLYLYRDDAFTLLNKIIDKIINSEGSVELKVNMLKKYIELHRKTNKIESEIEAEEITNPILNLEI